MRKCVAVLLGGLSSLAQSRPTVHNNIQERQDSGVPQYVLDHAPLCWLDTNEAYFPSDISTHLTHTHPSVNTTAITDAPSPLTLSNLDALNAYGDGGVNTYLTSNEGIDANPQPTWFFGTKPDISRSAPGSAIIVVPKDDSVVDALYFFFYSFDLGNFVVDDNYGNHVGDFEHTMIRFTNGTPTAMYFSQHASGEAFKYNIVLKDGATGRPLNYVAKGTHANYAIPGPHDHTIPNLNLLVGPLVDETSQGTLWDPLSQPLTFLYDLASDTFTSPEGSPTAWLDWTGRWGDPQLSDGDPNQKDLFGFKKYVAGPTGPKDKNLGRNEVCQGVDDVCIMREVLAP